MLKQDKILLINDKDYMLDLCIRMAHHSTAIEGNTLSQDETALILLNGYISKQMNEREFYEVRNYKDLMPVFIDNLKESKRLDSALIKEFHSIIMKDLLYNKGEFKTIQNVIVGSTLETAKPYLVPTKIKDLSDNLYFKFDKAANDDDKLQAILEAHIEFEKIHPFSDGNGRTGRFLIIYSCLEQNLAPIIIPKEQKGRYINILRTNDIKDFLEFGKEIQSVENERCEKFIENSLLQNFSKKLHYFIDKQSILLPEPKQRLQNEILKDYENAIKRGLKIDEKSLKTIKTIQKEQSKSR